MPLVPPLKDTRCVFYEQHKDVKDVLFVVGTENNVFFNIITEFICLEIFISEEICYENITIKMILFFLPPLLVGCVLDRSESEGGRG